MPPRRLSRFRFSFATTDDQDRVFLSDRERFFFREESDTISYSVVEGDTLFRIAARAYRDITDTPAQLFWVIADFQRPPIHDLTIKLEVGREILIPSTRLIDEEILNERRRT